jgi:hypothetical protein
MMLMMYAALAMPMVATGEDQTIPPEARWTPTPPTRSTADRNQLASVRVDTGMITRQDSIEPTLSQASSPSQYSRTRAWTWATLIPIPSGVPVMIKLSGARRRRSPCREPLWTPGGPVKAAWKLA